MSNEYIYPFDIGINKDVLCDLSSGVTIPVEILDTLLSLQDTGKQLTESFAKERLLSDDKSFHAPIKGNINKRILVYQKIFYNRER